MTRFRMVFRSRAGQTRTEEMTPRQLFGEFIRWHVSTLVERGLIHVGERYHSHITPRYDDVPQYGREIVYLETPERPWLEADDRPGWLSEPQVKGEPLRYFTLTLCTSPRGFVYRKDFPLAALNQTISQWTRLLDTELQVHRQEGWEWEIIALGPETAPSPTLPYSRVPDPFSPIIVVEHVPLSAEDVSTTEEPLGISVESVGVELPVKSLSPGPYQVHGTKSAGDLNILISRNTLHEIEQDAVKRDVEGGGLLLGEVFREETSGELVIHITAHIPAVGARGTIGSVWFTSEIWDAMLRAREQRYPNAQVVGWYHDHSIGTWLSLDDEFIHKNIFKEPWHVALVLGRRDGARRFFQWKGGQIVPCDFFRIIG